MAAKPKAKAQDAEQKWRNRIVSYGVKPADQFTHNPSNPKYHPPEQRAALKGALGEIGWIDTAVENVRTGYLIDGHERVWSALENNEEVPFIQVDLSPEEEAYALATLDPIGMMARHDAEKLDALLREVNSGEAGVQAMLDRLAVSAGLVPTDDPYAEWQGMPAFDQEELPGFHRVNVILETEADMVDFANKIGQTVTTDTKTVFYPMRGRGATRNRAIDDES